MWRARGSSHTDRRKWHILHALHLQAGVTGAAPPPQQGSFAVLPTVSNALRSRPNRGCPQLVRCQLQRQRWLRQVALPRCRCRCVCLCRSSRNYGTDRMEATNSTACVWCVWWCVEAGIDWHCEQFSTPESRTLVRCTRLPTMCRENSCNSSGQEVGSSTCVCRPRSLAASQCSCKLSCSPS